MLCHSPSNGLSGLWQARCSASRETCLLTSLYMHTMGGQALWPGHSATLNPRGSSFFNWTTRLLMLSSFTRGTKARTRKFSIFLKPKVFKMVSDYLSKKDVNRISFPLWVILTQSRIETLKLRAFEENIKRCMGNNVNRAGRIKTFIKQFSTRARGHGDELLPRNNQLVILRLWG